ncbi:hypothetical protein BDV38DRAFT_52211 [Aspergillus pseudotamarii]|uniref:Uncharacterized protein n=1 Tax=Aspergillus pseudotamarii TaxID=132259 RepID=A0A5N6SXW0_ASPPS|nr:uncharacterized protein BDV38DRAFT_52211 [Aspergillus pseudotamarii]KAE8139462.1 hypothetical protein BDV38DRAFT_52211 [Aspergillus pseudotamarii]
MLFMLWRRIHTTTRFNSDGPSTSQHVRCSNGSAKGRDLGPRWVMTLCRPRPRGTQRLKGGIHCDRRGGRKSARTFIPRPGRIKFDGPMDSCPVISAVRLIGFHIYLLFFFFFFFLFDLSSSSGLFPSPLCGVVKFDSKKWMALFLVPGEKWREGREGKTRVGSLIMLFHSSLDPGPVIPELPEAAQENKCPSLRASFAMIIPAPIRGLSPYIASGPNQ